MTILWNASCAHRRYMRLVEDGRGPAIVNCSPELWAAILTEANFRLGRVPEPLPDGRITFTMNRGELAVTLDCAREMENTNLYAAIVRAVESGAWPLVVNVSH